MSTGAGGPFRTVRIGEVAAAPTEERNRWLVHSLWPAGAVGMLGGSPKSCKTWLGLDLALSVASGTDCLGSFPGAHSRIPGHTVTAAGDVAMRCKHSQRLDL
jgi:hypothetical protein